MSYNGLAKVYDRFAYDFDYDVWTDWYLNLLRAQNASVNEICDCGCGTGSIAVRLAKKGYSVIGVDLSAEMLMEAQNKAHRCGVRMPFIKQDMRMLALPHRIDAVICACDGVNYLLTRKDVRSCFEHVYAHLKPGGVFAFDVSNTEKLSDSGFYGEELEGQAYMWENKYDAEQRILTMKLCLFVEEPDGRYVKYSETHTQKAHTRSEMAALLSDVGFTNIQIIGNDFGESSAPGGKRMYFSAKKGID